MKKDFELLKELVRKKWFARNNGASQEFIDAIQRQISAVTKRIMGY